MTIQTLEFSHNWNHKLQCDYFTTLRISDRFSLGETVEVHHANMEPFRATVVDKRSLTKLQLNDWICCLDTGYPTAETIGILNRMYPNSTDRTPFFWYLLKKEK